MGESFSRHGKMRNVHKNLIGKRRVDLEKVDKDGKIYYNNMLL
jgi:hypothetical protein